MVHTLGLMIYTTAHRDKTGLGLAMPPIKNRVAPGRSSPALIEAALAVAESAALSELSTLSTVVSAAKGARRMQEGFGHQ